MGNCLRHESEVIWGGDNWGAPEEWGSPASEKLFKKETRHGGWRRDEEADIPEDDEEDEMLLGLGELNKKRKKKRGGGGVGSSSASVHYESTEVMKIKVTKKEFEELTSTGKGDVQQMLSQLMNVGDRYQLAHQRSWRPALKSIPE
ncbi:uncharacterized protein LOC122090647 [Macadamia integrifolia]|uniref:uncharacterized protein LOC122090647 n=1 Tax=Macadamia integrifolia TaxID=60698 RepID=UPI001C4F6947|nr:uncharacterized protein LOC122090647 [Macadamia integrifolia]